MSRMHQIHEEDLAELEKRVPDLLDRYLGKATNADRVQVRRVKEILSNVRWNYGPHTDVEVVPAEDGQ